MIIVTTLYNAEEYVERCLGSIMGQTHKDFKCYITDDMSTDNSVKLVKAMIAGDERFILIENTSKLYQGGNYDMVIRNNDDISDNEIIVEIDGDDWLPNSKTLEYINSIYQDEEVWITNGSFKYANGAQGFSSKQIIDERLRVSPMTCSHIRTWRAFLWRKIKLEDLKDETGTFWPVAGDLSFMFPMLEMAGDEHYRFLENINYIYNDINPLNDHKQNLPLVQTICQKIRSMKPYSKLESNGIL